MREVIAQVFDVGHRLTGTEIIRCKDCERWVNERSGRDGKRWCVRHAELMPPEGFCSVARKAEPTEQSIREE